jgi:hypothetical protein
MRGEPPSTRTVPPYLLALTAVVVLASAGLVLQFEQDSGDSTISSLGDALGWSSAVVTTVACDLDPVTIPGHHQPA